jgi:hypothetical protein
MEHAAEHVALSSKPPVAHFRAFDKLGSMPPFAARTAKVSWLISALQQISAAGVPAYPCFRMNAFCASVNFDAFIVLSSSPSQESRAGFRGHRDSDTVALLPLQARSARRLTEPGS